MKGFLRKLIRADRGVLIGAGVLLLLAAGAFPFDHAVTDHVREVTGGHPGDLARLVTNFGYALTPAVIFVVLLVLYGEERTGLQGLLGMFAAGMVTDTLKVIVGRTRPDGSALSFPSGHSTVAFATAVVLAHRWPRWRWAFYGGALAVAASRVVRLRHFPSDVLAGGAIGLVFGMATMVFVQDWALLASRRAMFRLKVVLSVLLVISVVVLSHRAQPLATLAAPALLLIVARRAGALLKPGIEP